MGQRLRSRRKELGLSQQKLAAPNYTHAYVSTIESDKAFPSVVALTYFAQKLGMSVEELATGRPPDLQTRLADELASARKAVSAGRVADATAAFDRVAGEAQAFDLPAVVAQAEVGRALVAEREGRLRDAVRSCERAEVLLQGSRPAERVEAAAVKGRCLQAIGQTRKAAYYLVRLLEEVRAHGDADAGALARLHASLIAVFFELGLYDKVSDCVAEALQLSSQVDESEHLANMHLNVARALLAEQRFEEAERSLAKALELFTKLELRTEVGRAHFARGYVLSRKSQPPEEALREFEVALQTFKETDAKVDEARVAQEMARIMRTRGEVEEAIDLLKRSITLLRVCPHAGTLAFSYRELGLCHSESNPREAERHLKKSVELFEESDESVEAAAAYLSLGDLYLSQERHDEGLQTFRRGLLGLEALKA